MPTFTMRLPEADYEALQALSLITGQPMAELVRDAIGSKVTTFAQSEEMHDRLNAKAEERQAAVAKLEERTATPAT